MSYAFIQQADGVVNGSGTTVATGTGGTNFPSSLTAGNFKWFVVLYVAAAQVVITLSDPNNNNATHVQTGTAFASSVGSVWGYVKNLVGGVGTTTATAASAVTFFSVYCAEYSGLDVFQTTAAGKRQASPGTVTDAVISSSMTPTSQPAVIIGYTHDSTTNTLANAGTGFTARAGAVNYGSGLVARPEDKRITDLTGLSATWTATGGTGTYWSFAGIFSESPTQKTSFGGGRFWRKHKYEDEPIEIPAPVEEALEPVLEPVPEIKLISFVQQPKINYREISSRVSKEVMGEMRKLKDARLLDNEEEEEEAVLILTLLVN